MFCKALLVAFLVLSGAFFGPSLHAGAPAIVGGPGPLGP